MLLNCWSSFIDGPHTMSTIPPEDHYRYESDGKTVDEPVSREYIQEPIHTDIHAMDQVKQEVHAL